MTFATEQSRQARLNILRGTFAKLQDRYRREHQDIGWATRPNGVTCSPEYLLDKYEQNVEVVRNDLMWNTTGLLDRHKIIALSQYTILETQPLILTHAHISDDADYLANVRFAFDFGIRFIARWNERLEREPFDMNTFLYPLLHTDAGKAFIQEHHTLLMLKHQPSHPPIPLMWTSQLWFLIEQWGLTHMRQAFKFQPKNP